MTMKKDFEGLGEDKYLKFIEMLSDVGYVIVPREFIENRKQFLREILEELNNEDDT